MRARIIVPIGLSMLLCGCSLHEGIYSPSCAAYAGSEIELDGGRFIWTKFTDEVLVDEGGNVVEQNPGFPARGEYSKTGQQITLIPGESEPTQAMFLSPYNGELYLYTADEMERLETTGERPECALRLQKSPVKN